MREEYNSVLTTPTDSGVSRVWQAWPVPWAPLWRGRKNCLQKIKSFFYSFLNLYFSPHIFTNCKVASTKPLT